MIAIIDISKENYDRLLEHLFSSTTEQGAFLFAMERKTPDEISLVVNEIYLVPEDGWECRTRAYLELREEEKVKIMLMARERQCCLVECHSHRFSADRTTFSPSDRRGLEEFLGYVRWKLNGKTYGAVVFGDSSMEGQLWPEARPPSLQIGEIRVSDSRPGSSCISRFVNWVGRFFHILK